MVHVATTISTVQDIELTDAIHDDLAERHLLPAEHVVDSGYISPARIERAQQVHGVTLLGPVVADHSAQAKANSGFGKAAFTIDWDSEQAICPRGATSASWTKLNIKDHTYLQARFAEADCRTCPDRAQCTTSATKPRSISVLPRPLHEIQMSNRLDQRTEQWQRRYAIRAGIEATLSQNVRTHGLRRSRYRGLARTHVQHVLTATACNITRVSDWISAPPEHAAAPPTFTRCAQPPHDRVAPTSPAESPQIRTPAQGDRWTWLILVGHTRLRLARHLAPDLRRRWEKPLPAHRALTSGRVHRGFAYLRRLIGTPARKPKPTTPGPGRPPGSTRALRTRYPVGKKPSIPK